MRSGNQKDARIPKDLNLSAWVRAILDAISVQQRIDARNVRPLDRRSERRPELLLAEWLKVDRRTVESWRDAAQTESGPSVQLNSYNFQDLYSEARSLGVNMEAFCIGPELWGRRYDPMVPGQPLPNELDPGKRFRVHGGSLAGEMLAAPLFLMAGPLSIRANQVRWMLRSGFAGVEMKTCLSHRRDPRRTDQLSSLTEIPTLSLARDQPPASVLTIPYDRELGKQHGWAVRLGAPSLDPALWIPEVDAALDAAVAGQVVIPSIAAHVSEEANISLLLSDWRRVAEYLKQTKARLASINIGCAALHNYRLNIPLAIQAFQEVATVLKGAKLFAKLPYLDESQLEEFMLGTGDVLSGVMGINCETGIGCSLNQDGRRIPIWAEKNSEVGIAGPALFPLAKAFLTHFLRIKARHRSLNHVAVVVGGGIYQLDQLSTLLGIGADAVGLNSILLYDSYFGLKARRYIDSQTDRRGVRVSLEISTINEIWLEAYTLEVEPHDPSTEMFATRHKNAVTLLDKLLLESHMRIGVLEDAAKEGKRIRPLLTLAEMRELIRNGFNAL